MYSIKVKLIGIPEVYPTAWELILISKINPKTFSQKLKCWEQVHFEEFFVTCLA